MSLVTIVGAGMMGTAMSWPLSDNGHSVRLAGTPLDDEIVASLRANRSHPTLQRAIPDGVQVFDASQLAEALQGAELVIGGVSSFGVDWFAQAAGPHLPEGARVLSVTKGLEEQPNGDLWILPRALRTKLPPEQQDQVSLNAVGGPCIAHELAARRQTAVVFCGEQAETLARTDAGCWRLTTITSGPRRTRSG